MSKKIAIIGAGASGLLCAIQLAKKNYQVTLFEKNNKIGKKLLATGNGRCNITNTNITKSNFHSINTKFIDYTLSKFSYDDCKKLFSNMGIEFIKDKNSTKVFPTTLSSSSVVELLKYEATRYGVKIILNYDVQSIIKKEKFSIDDKYTFSKVILANGSNAMKKLGGSNSGYYLAESLGHTIVEPFSSLVQLVCNEKKEYLEAIAGLKIEAKCNNISGDLLFTKYGLSGSMILDLSREISYTLQYENSVKLSVDTMPSFSKDKLKDILIKRLNISYDKSIPLWLDGFIHPKLTIYIMKKSNIKKQYAKDLTKKDILQIVFLLKNLEFKIISTKGFEFAEVSAGGVDTFEINDKNFESKIIKNLFVIGELLDIDGDCGGYNLHFAWASAYLCAKQIL